MKTDIYIWHKDQLHIFDYSKKDWDSLQALICKKGLSPCFCYDPQSEEEEYRSGCVYKVVGYNNEWGHVPIELLPYEFKATLMLYGVYLV